MDYKPSIKKATNYIEPQLSQKDEGVPDTHIGIYDIFVMAVDENGKPNKVFGANLATELRKNTFKNAVKLYEQCGSRDFCSFWNLHISELADIKVIEFAKYAQVEPFCQYIECFKTDHKTQKSRKKKHLISFGINKQTLKLYREKEEEAKRLGIEFIPPSYVKKGRPFNKDMYTNGSYEIRLSEKITASVPKNEIFYRFDHWCKLNKYTKRRGVEMAMEAVVLMNPTEGINELKDYKQETVFDKLLYTNKKGRVKKGISFDCNGQLHEDMLRIIDRYNNDSDNYLKENLTSGAYINNAISLLNSKMDLKYRNPKLADELKANEEYVKNIAEMKKKGGKI